MATSHDNIIPFPTPSRVREQDSLAREIADIFDNAKCQVEPGDEDRLVSRLEHLAARLERIVQTVNA